jgi:hypothetical protein
MTKKKTVTPMDKLTAGYEKFIKEKETKKNGKVLFDKAIHKAANIKKGRGSK